LKGPEIQHLEGGSKRFYKHKMNVKDSSYRGIDSKAVLTVIIRTRKKLAELKILPTTITSERPPSSPEEGVAEAKDKIPVSNVRIVTSQYKSKTVLSLGFIR
jgi:hypothetical protein